jgi:hypothetical protein
MSVPHVQLRIQTLMVAVALIALGLWLWILAKSYGGPVLGLALYLILRDVGLEGTRIGSELAFIIDNSFGIAGQNTASGNGLGDREYFPWLLLSLASLSIGILTAARLVIRRAREGRSVDRQASAPSL